MLHLMFGPIQVPFELKHPNAKLPAYGRPGDAGLDLTVVAREFKPQHIEYDFGVACAIPHGYVGLIIPRSGVTDMNLMLKNGVGVIDSNYRGNLKARFKHVHFDQSYGTHDIGSLYSDMVREQSSREERDRILKSEVIYEVGERAAQLLILPYPAIEPVETKELPESNRGDAGWSSTGRR